MTTPTLAEFKAKFLAENPNVEGPLKLLGLLGDSLTGALDEMIEKAYEQHIASNPAEHKAPE